MEEVPVVTAFVSSVFTESTVFSLKFCHGSVGGLWRLQYILNTDCLFEESEEIPQSFRITMMMLVKRYY